MEIHNANDLHWDNNRETCSLVIYSFWAATLIRACFKVWEIRENFLKLSGWHKNVQIKKMLKSRHNITISSHDRYPVEEYFDLGL